MKKIFLTLCCMFLFVGISQAAKDAKWVIKKAKIDEDSFSKTTTINFPDINYRQVSPAEVKEKTGKSVWSAPYFYYWIKVIKSNNSEKAYVIWVKEILTNLAGHKDFNEYTKALDKDGTELNFKMEKFYDPDHNKYGSAFKSPTPEEEFSITVSKEYLEKFREDGLVIKVYGSKEDGIFHISNYYIDGVLKYFEDKK